MSSFEKKKEKEQPKGVRVTPSTNMGTVTEVPTMTRTEFDSWVRSLYDFKMDDKELRHIVDIISYKGFNREDVLKQLSKIADIKTIIELILLCALRGPVGASKTTMTNGKNPLQMGIPASGGKGVKTLTCGKITAATADLAAYYLKRSGAPKRMLIELPAWLQFPSAGSIKMSDTHRAQHIEFSKRFSPMIGGEFNEQIYAQMVQNAYLDESLNLFG
jgi:hypothetical protein